MVAPLTAVECELLEAIAQAGRARDEAASVLADYWIEQVDEARGAFLHLQYGDRVERLDLADEEARLAPQADRWRAAVCAGGFAEQHVALCDGFVEPPLVVPAGHELDGHPDLVRISPRYYREVHCLREGVDCNVYEAAAVTPRTTTRVAIKSARHVGARALIEREQAVLDRITHPNVARVIGHAMRSDGRALVFPWYGTDLRRLLASAQAYGRPLGVGFGISVGVQLLDAIRAVHAAAIVHGEVRPDHVMLAGDGTVTLVDFGFVHGEPARPHGSYRISPGMPADLDFRIGYMSPEQARGLALAPSTDVFSAAGLICELITNTHPLGADFPSLYAQVVHLAQRQLVPPPGIPAHFAVPLRLALEHASAHRPTVEHLRATLATAADLAGVAIGPSVIAQRLVELGVPV